MFALSSPAVKRDGSGRHRWKKQEPRAANGLASPFRMRRSLRACLVQRAEQLVNERKLVAAAAIAVSNRVGAAKAHQPTSTLKAQRQKRLVRHISEQVKKCQNKR
jgi:hypothetical protein